MSSSRKEKLSEAEKRSRKSKYHKEWNANLDAGTKKRNAEAKVAKRKDENAAKYLGHAALALFESGLEGDEALDATDFSYAARAVCHAYARNPLQRSNEDADKLSSAELKAANTKRTIAKQRIRHSADKAVGKTGSELLKWPKTDVHFADATEEKQLAFRDWFLGGGPGGASSEDRKLYPFWVDVCAEFDRLRARHRRDDVGGGGHGEVVADPGPPAARTELPSHSFELPSHSFDLPSHSFELGGADVSDLIDPRLWIGSGAPLPGSGWQEHVGAGTAQPPAHDPKGKGKGKAEAPAPQHHHQHHHHHHSEQQQQHHQDTGGRTGPSSSSSSQQQQPAAAVAPAKEELTLENNLGFYVPSGSSSEERVPFYKSDKGYYFWRDHGGAAPVTRKCKFAFNDNAALKTAGFAVDPTTQTLEPFFCRKRGSKDKTEAFYFQKQGHSYRYLDGMDRTVWGW